MRYTRSGRFVFIAQWFAAVLLPLFLFVGRGLLGVELGWMALVGIVYSIYIIPAMYLPPILTLFDRETRARGFVRLGYAISCWVMWGAILVASLSIPDASDGPSLPSFLSLVFGLSEDDSAAVSGSAIIVVGLSWLAAIVTAIMGIVVGRRMPQAPAVPAAPGA